MNAKNLTTGIYYSFGGITESFDFIYDQSKDNAPYQATFTDGSATRILYDRLGRKTKDSLYKNNTAFFSSTYSYLNKASDPNRTSGLVSEIDYNLSSIEDLEYSYDSRGNITHIREGGILLESYTYDKLNRLTRVDSLTQAKTIQYEYDQSGNILSKKEYPYLNTTTPTSTISYTYGSVDWKDSLTKYDGKTIIYDGVGNPLSYDGKIFTWLGRRLASYKNGSTTTSYKYNSDGIRTSKTVGSTKTEYFLDGSTILAQKTGSNVIPFYYDANGTRIAFKYNGTMYYYVYNLQGDVTHIIDASKNIVDTYQYDAWGKILNLNSLTAIAQANPFRYRGYYYDNESGLYYLNSRYYNAEWGRFINADGYVSTGQGITGYNMFTYCGNNPVMYLDPGGNASIAITMKMLDKMVTTVKKICTNDNIKNWNDLGNSSSGDLSSSEMHENAEIIFNILTLEGWSINAICAVLGNMQHESVTINPGRYQNGGGPGYGLVQWDPASKYLNWAVEYGYSNDSLTGQVAFLVYSMQPGKGEWFRNQIYQEYYLPYNDFISSNSDVAYLTSVFVWSYERPGIAHMNERIKYSTYWYNYFCRG